jgi:citrate lyase subunit beta/citryl-CoA lyase
MHPNKNRIRRTMMFLNAHRASLVKDAYIYKPDSVIFDLEDAVSENQKDSARIQLYNTLKYSDYKGVERLVRINGKESQHWKEDIRAAVAGGCDGIRIPKCEYKSDVALVEEEVRKAELEFQKPLGSTLLMAAIETPMGVINALELSQSSERIFGISIGAGDFMRTMHAKRTSEGYEMLAARSQLVLAARASDIMCFDTVHTDVDDFDGLRKDTELIKNMGFDGKSVISPKQISVIHQVFTPSQKEIQMAEKTIYGVEASAKEGVGVIVVDGQMIDIAMVEGAKRVLTLAKASGVYRGDL